MPYYALIDQNATIAWKRDPHLLSVTPRGPGAFVLEFDTDTSRDVFVFSAKTAGEGCDAPLVIAAAVQDGSNRICVRIGHWETPSRHERAQFSYIRYAWNDER